MRTRNPGRRAVLATLAAALIVMAIGSPAVAASPQALTLVSTTTFNDNGPNYGTFEASGPAVGNGVVCASGTFVDTGIHFAGFQSNKAVQLTVFKTYSCRDGDFYVTMQIHANFDGTECSPGSSPAEPAPTPASSGVAGAPPCPTTRATSIRSWGSSSTDRPGCHGLRTGPGR